MQPAVTLLFPGDCQADAQQSDLVQDHQDQARKQVIAVVEGGIIPDLGIQRHRIQEIADLLSCKTQAGQVGRGVSLVELADHRQGIAADVVTPDEVGGVIDEFDL